MATGESSQNVHHHRVHRHVTSSLCDIIIILSIIVSIIIMSIIMAIIIMSIIVCIIIMSIIMFIITIEEVTMSHPPCHST